VLAQCTWPGSCVARRLLGVVERAAVTGRGGRIRELDLARAVALVAVAIIHSSAWLVASGASPSAGFLPALASLARVCVPAFVLLSGATLWHLYGAPRPPAGWFLRKRASRLLVPWALAVLLFLLVALYTREVHDTASLVSWLAYGAGHLYFLLLIAQFYLLFLLLPRGRAALWWTALAALVLQEGLDALHTYGPNLSGAAAWAGTYLAQEEFPFWIGLFLIGCLAGRHLLAILERYRWWPLALLVTLIAGWLTLLEGSHVGGSMWQQGTGAYFWPSRLPFTCAFTLTLLWLGRALAGWLAHVQAAIDVLGQHSLGIYILHPLPLVLLGPATGGWADLPRLLLLLVSTLGFGTLAVLAWSRRGRDVRDVWLASHKRPSPSPLV